MADDVALPRSAGAPVGFVIYPQAETSDGRLDSLDPDNFKYEMTAREMPSTERLIVVGDQTAETSEPGDDPWTDDLAVNLRIVDQPR